MARIGKRGYLVLKLLHVFFASTMLGGAACSLLLFMVGANGGSVSPFLDIARLIHWIIVIPSAAGTLVTGILFSVTTKWGFFKHRWITIKYGIMAFSILTGALIIRQQYDGMIAIAKKDLSTALANPVFISDRTGAIIQLTIHVVLLSVAVYLSVFRPRIGPPGTKHDSI